MIDGAKLRKKLLYAYESENSTLEPYTVIFMLGLIEGEETNKVLEDYVKADKILLNSLYGRKKYEETDNMKSPLNSLYGIIREEDDRK